VGAIRLTRIYGHEPRSAGKVFLVERLRAQGIRHDEIHLDGWLKDVGPQHRPAPVVQSRPDQVAAVPPPLRRRTRRAAGLAATDRRGSHRRRDLFYSSRDREHHKAVVLRAYLKTDTNPKRRG
jgi:uncharacterized protein YeaO (DUF488 family)